MKKDNKLISLIFGIALAVLIITFSIGLPIYVRPFYYWHIDALEMPEYTEWSREQIKDAYDDVLDYLTLPGHEFGTGELKYSEEGKAHFADCKVLFDLNRNALLISLATVVLLLILNKRGAIRLSHPGGLGVPFYSGVSVLITFVSVGLLASQNFDKAFTVFHKIFFPGKDNWMFDPRTDEIIWVMPQEFFMDCAILICLSIVLISITLICVEVAKKRREK